MHNLPVEVALLRAYAKCRGHFLHPFPRNVALTVASDMGTHSGPTLVLACTTRGNDGGPQFGRALAPWTLRLGELGEGGRGIESFAEAEETVISGTYQSGPQGKCAARLRLLCRLREIVRLEQPRPRAKLGKQTISAPNKRLEKYLKFLSLLLLTRLQLRPRFLFAPSLPGCSNRRKKLRAHDFALQF